MSAKIDLCLHMGADKVSWGEVRRAATPEGTKSWQPIPHEALVGEVLEAFDNAGYEVVQEVHALSHEDQRYFGMMQLRHTKEEKALAVRERETSLKPIERALVVGLRNSHDKTFPAGLVVGDGVFVCDNLCFSGEIKIGRKHTRYIERDLPRLVTQAVGRLSEARKLQNQRFEHYRLTEISDMQVNDLLVRSLDARVISSSKIVKVLKEWRAPSHPEFAEAKNYHRLHAAYTEVLKGSNPFTLPNITQRLHGLLDADSGLTTRPVIDVEATAA